MLTKFALPILFLLATLALGFWLSRRGRPYPGLLFNAHKLTALAAVVLALLRLWPLPGGWPLPALLLAAAGVLALFASGALLSARRPNHSRLLLIHWLGLAALAVSVGWLAYGML